ncbi:Bgt-3829 [Blumeria graminis f. sp. tritici]|uniref:Bgt-3829 n=2 Tax=Blumeria graminis f. sp. tritici TaxID=62690 RepID=A0A061HN79_BLUGR|nr:hypothetical protein BGT96224_3829 [Blumeria graminis f. sp. tritici 96224]VDB89299.1 Bgt-3829 [Blumeria graminis f. sp. tritici]
MEEYFLGRFPTAAPPVTSFRDDKPSLLISWWCTLYSLAIIIFRIMGRYIRTEKIFLDDQVMVLSIIPLLSRMALETVVIIHGTNNVEITSLTPTQIHGRELGSKMVLVSRILYAIFLWTIKYSISIFLQTLTAPIWKRSHQIQLRYLHVFLVVTFLMTIVATLAPCQPFTQFWQVVPDPGSSCRQNFAQIFTLGGLNIVTNIVLVVFPFPIVLMSGLPMKQYVFVTGPVKLEWYTYSNSQNTRKSTILFRLSLPVFPIFLTIYAIIHLTRPQASATSQIIRTLYISIDMLLTTLSANAVVLFSLLQDKGYKKSKFKHVREPWNFKRPARVLRASYLSGSVVESAVPVANHMELCDAGGLLNEVVIGASQDDNEDDYKRKSESGLNDIPKREIRKCNEWKSLFSSTAVCAWPKEKERIARPDRRQDRKVTRNIFSKQSKIETWKNEKRNWGRVSLRSNNRDNQGKLEISSLPPVPFSDTGGVDEGNQKRRI